MGVSTGDLYGGAPRGEPATPGSYGQPPLGAALPGRTRLGPVRLAVADVARSRTYYEDVLGLTRLDVDSDAVVLGPRDGSRQLIELVEQRGLTRADARPHWGLYHFALLLPDRASLGRFVRHLATQGVRAGAGDHLVSEAFYLTDPDGLGIEVYADRPREQWRRLGRELMLATDPVNVPDLVRVAGDAVWDGMPPDTVVGHVHLHVGDIATAGDFYGDTLGFDRTTWRYPGALFLGAGGYHHHVGTNTWAGPTASAPRRDEARLLSWRLVVPAQADVDAVAGRLTGAGHHPVRVDGGAIEVADPWGTGLCIEPDGPA